MVDGGVKAASASQASAPQTTIHSSKPSAKAPKRLAELREASSVIGPIGWRPRSAARINSGWLSGRTRVFRGLLPRFTMARLVRAGAIGDGCAVDAIDGRVTRARRRAVGISGIREGEAAHEHGTWGNDVGGARFDCGDEGADCGRRQPHGSGGYDHSYEDTVGDAVAFVDADGGGSSSQCAGRRTRRRIGFQGVSTPTTMIRPEKNFVQSRSLVSKASHPLSIAVAM